MKRYLHHVAEFMDGPWAGQYRAIKGPMPEIRVAIAPPLSLDIDYAKPVVDAIKTGTYELRGRSIVSNGMDWMGLYYWKGVDVVDRSLQNAAPEPYKMPVTVNPSPAKAMPSDDELYEAAERYIMSRGSTLWGQSWNVYEKDSREQAAEWLAGQVRAVLRQVWWPSWTEKL